MEAFVIQATDKKLVPCIKEASFKKNFHHYECRKEINKMIQLVKIIKIIHLLKISPLKKCDVTVLMDLILTCGKQPTTLRHAKHCARSHPVLLRQTYPLPIRN